MSESKHTIYGSLTALDREDVTRVLWTRKRCRELLEAQSYTFRSLREVPTSKYMPHQGSKEIERRVKQALRDAAKKAEQI